MGCDVTIVTACTEATEAELRAHVQGSVKLAVTPSSDDTRFGFGPDADAGPTRLVSAAPRLTSIGDEQDVDIVHLAPVFNELEPSLIAASARHARFVGVTPQGLLRSTSPDGSLTLAASNWPVEVAAADAMVMSDAEYAHLSGLGLLDGYGGWLFRTLGAEGASLHRDGVEVDRRRPVVRFDVEPQRTIGAGDVFAAAAFVSLARGNDPDEALDVAVSCASTYVQRTSAEPSYVDGAGRSEPAPPSH
jgi:sugar/nucleoside kinase (ribokinase family)